MRTPLIALIAALAGCSDDLPVDVAGTYAMNITNGDNGCELQNWTEGESSTGIPVVVVQNGADATARIDGVVGAYVELVLGSREFDGRVSGNAFDAELFGTRQGTQGGCAFTMNAELDSSLARDTLTGTISYIPKTNDHPDCGLLQTCRSVQMMNGLRAP